MKHISNIFDSQNQFSKKHNGGHQCLFEVTLGHTLQGWEEPDSFSGLRPPTLEQA